MTFHELSKFIPGLLVVKKNYNTNIFYEALSANMVP